MFDLLIVCYLFLGGIGAGACFVSAMAGLFVPKEYVSVAVVNGTTGSPQRRIVIPDAYKTLFAPVYICATGLLALGVLLLIVDAGNFDKLIFLFIQPRAAYISIGSYALFFCVVLGLALFLIWNRLIVGLRSGVLTGLGIAMALVSFFVMLYTGLLLQSLSAVPLWTSPWLPVLFVLSSVSCGLALVVDIAQFTGAPATFPSVFRRFIACDAILMLCEIVVVVVFLSTVTTSVPGDASSSTAIAASQSVDNMLNGPSAPVFWGGFVLVGMGMPLTIEAVALVTGKLHPRAALALAACVLIGGFALRYGIVEAGMRPALVVAGLG